MQQPATYRIRVHGGLNPDWSSRLEGMHISSDAGGKGEPHTVLLGSLPDQAALSGVLNTLYELHLPLVSVDCLEAQDRDAVS